VSCPRVTVTDPVALRHLARVWSAALGTNDRRQLPRTNRRSSGQVAWSSANLRRLTDLRRSPHPPVAGPHHESASRPPGRTRRRTRCRRRPARMPSAPCPGSPSRLRATPTSGALFRRCPATAPAISPDRRPTPAPARRSGVPRLPGKGAPRPDRRPDRLPAEASFADGLRNPRIQEAIAQAAVTGSAVDVGPRPRLKIGILGARIADDGILDLVKVLGRELAAARDHGRAEAFAAERGVAKGHGGPALRVDACVTGVCTHRERGAGQGFSLDSRCRS